VFAIRAVTLQTLINTLSVCHQSCDAYAGASMAFTRGTSKPKSANLILQALSCRFFRLQLSNPSKLVISKKWKTRIALRVHNAWGFSPFERQNRKTAHLALPQTRPTLFEKIPRGGFELNETP